MDPPLVNEASFTAAANPNSYSLAGLLSFSGSGGLGLRMGNLGGGDEESTVTEQSGSGNGGVKRRRDVGSSFDDDSSKIVSTSSANQDVSDSNVKRVKVSESEDQLKTEAETHSGSSSKPAEEKSKPEPPKDYIHVRARRGQATDSHSLAERARREKISERMKILQDLVPGCNKVPWLLPLFPFNNFVTLIVKSDAVEVIGKALVLDEIINYIQSLQRQVEFLSMKLEAVNSRLSPTIEGFSSKDAKRRRTLCVAVLKVLPKSIESKIHYLGLDGYGVLSLFYGAMPADINVMQLAGPAFDANGMIYGPQTPGVYARGSQAEWLHMQVGGGFERST
ncbi:hypothetical protein SASPL_157245 [Salvia splendens]|uniref:BHLH domain-containing protein n=1 Tax=Salvia splendens TaxID=180675 RepID=A0A8X8VV80_SALSN|nr:hypothetical protein SASPL_157245 [Salvia splendens]